MGVPAKEVVGIRDPQRLGKGVVEGRRAETPPRRVRDGEHWQLCPGTVARPRRKNAIGAGPLEMLLVWKAAAVEKGRVGVLIGSGNSRSKGVHAMGAGNRVDLTKHGDEEAFDVVRARHLARYAQLGKEASKGVTGFCRDKTFCKVERVLGIAMEVESLGGVREQCFRGIVAGREEVRHIGKKGALLLRRQEVRFEGEFEIKRITKSVKPRSIDKPEVKQWAKLR